MPIEIKKKIVLSNKVYARNGMYLVCFLEVLCGSLGFITQAFTALAINLDMIDRFSLVTLNLSRRDWLVIYSLCTNLRQQCQYMLRIFSFTSILLRGLFINTVTLVKLSHFSKLGAGI